MAANKERLNELAASFGDIETRRKLIAEFGDLDSAFMGENQDGVDIMISVAKTGIIEKVFQDNGKVCVNEYDQNGFLVSQKYESY